MDDLLETKNLQLYVALYALDGALREIGPVGPQEYWWAFLVAPENATKDQNGIRYRMIQKEVVPVVKGQVQMDKIEWEINRSLVPLSPHDDIVARVLIAEVEDAKAVEEHIKNAWPEKTMGAKKCNMVQTSQDWVQRVHEGLGGLIPGSLSGSSYMLATRLAKWEKIETCCTNFARVPRGSASHDAIPTWDLLKDEEVMPMNEISKTVTISQEVSSV